MIQEYKEKVNASDNAEVYLASDIQKILHLGRSKSYEYLEEVYRKQEPFRVIKIGRLYRVPKCSFDEWLNRL